MVAPGVNLLVGTESGLMLLDRSGQGKVYPLINRRRIQQMDVLEGLNVLVTISGTCSFPQMLSLILTNERILNKVTYMAGGIRLSVCPNIFFRFGKNVLPSQ